MSADCSTNYICTSNVNDTCVSKGFEIAISDNDQNPSQLGGDQSISRPHQTSVIPPEDGDTISLVNVIMDRNKMLESLKTVGYHVIDTTPYFQRQLKNTNYNQRVIEHIYTLSCTMQSQHDRKRKWIKINDLCGIRNNDNRSPRPVFLTICNLWLEAYSELRDVIDPRYDVQNVLALISGPLSDLNQVAHFDALPRSYEQVSLGPLTALGYMEDYSIDLWPGSHHLARHFRSSVTASTTTTASTKIGHNYDPSPIPLKTVKLRQYQILLFASDLLHRGVSNPVNLYKTRVSAMLRCRHSLTSEGGRVGCSGGNVSVATAAATEGNENDENKDDYYDESDHNYDGKVHTERRDCCYRRSDESTLGCRPSRSRPSSLLDHDTVEHGEIYYSMGHNSDLFMRKYFLDIDVGVTE